MAVRNYAIQMFICRQILVSVAIARMVSLRNLKFADTKSMLNGERPQFFGTFLAFGSYTSDLYLVLCSY